MRVLGVDPGGTSTGLAVVSDVESVAAGGIMLDAAATITRDAGTELLPVSRGYVFDVVSWIHVATSRFDVDLIAVEGINRPSWHVGGKAKPLDPTGIIATAVVLGAILGRVWPEGLVVVPPGSSRLLPANAYPEAVRAKAGGKGHDKKRHMRSAIDVALQARAIHALDTRRRGARV